MNKQLFAIKPFPVHLTHYSLCIFGSFETHKSKISILHFFWSLFSSSTQPRFFREILTVLTIHLFSKFLHVNIEVSFFLAPTEAGEACPYLWNLNDHKILEQCGCILFISLQALSAFCVSDVFKDLWYIFTINHLKWRMYPKQKAYHKISPWVHLSEFDDYCSTFLRQRMMLISRDMCWFAFCNI